MRDWTNRMEEYGCNLVTDSLIIREALEDDCIECLELGRTISNMMSK